jgi:hypothetical protein
LLCIPVAVPILQRYVQDIVAVSGILKPHSRHFLDHELKDRPQGIAVVIPRLGLGRTRGKNLQGEGLEWNIVAKSPELQQPYDLAQSGFPDRVNVHLEARL